MMYEKDEKKKMMYGGMAKKKMMEGGMAKKKMMKGGRMMYNKGGATQPEYKSGDMPKCMPN